MKFKVVYVLCPSKLITGGTEALHQLVDGLRTLGIDGRIVYYDSKHVGINKRVPLKFKHYKIQVDTKIKDQSSNAVVVPEIAPQFLEKYSESEKFIWWLSADYCPTGTIERVKRLDVTSLYQSHYARQKIESNGLVKSFPLSDYSVVYPIELGQKRNIIALTSTKIDPRYNNLLTQIKANFKYIYLKKMSRIRLAKTLSKTKLLIDFGFHPGKDRLPREAVWLRNIILTSTNGSCANDIDINIPKKYKIEPTEHGESLNTAITQYLSSNTFNGDFDMVIGEVARERDIFHKEIASIFGVKGPIELTLLYTKYFKFWSRIEHLLSLFPTVKYIKRLVKSILRQ